MELLLHTPEIGRWIWREWEGKGGRVINSQLSSLLPRCSSWQTKFWLPEAAPLWRSSAIASHNWASPTTQKAVDATSQGEGSWILFLGRQLSNDGCLGMAAYGRFDATFSKARRSLFLHLLFTTAPTVYQDGRLTFDDSLITGYHEIIIKRLTDRIRPLFRLISPFKRNPTLPVSPWGGPGRRCGLYSRPSSSSAQVGHPMTCSGQRTTCGTATMYIGNVDLHDESHPPKNSDHRATTIEPSSWGKYLYARTHSHACRNKPSM